MSKNPLKNMINASVVFRMGTTFREIYSSFNLKRFKKNTSNIEKLELKERVKLLTKALNVELPEDYLEANSILKKVILKNKLTGFELWPVSEYISQFGTNNFKESFEVMYLLTSRFTSEFAIRPFLLKDQQQVLRILKEWIGDQNVHVRRWISEGTRPILPWGGKVPELIKNPELTISLLEELKYDEELYVRKSIANHLNDITKNHPDFVIKLLSRWLKEAPREENYKIEWIKKHALRVLVKKGHQGALKLMGVIYSSTKSIKITHFKLNAKKFRLNDVIEFEFILYSDSKKEKKIIIDYLIYFKKSNGSTSPKAFKLKTIQMIPGENIKISKKHHLKKITTMNFYKGRHEICIQINGKIFDKVSWDFI